MNIAKKYVKLQGQGDMKFYHMIVICYLDVKMEVFGGILDILLFFQENIHCDRSLELNGVTECFFMRNEQKL